MKTFTPINLADLTAPQIFANPDEEAIFEEMRAEMIKRNPIYEGALQVNGEPLVEMFRMFAWRLYVLMVHANGGSLQQLLAYATGTNLDWIGQYLKGGLKRHVISGGDATARPPVPPTFEDDEAYRTRLQLAPESKSVAGPVGAYISLARNADPLVKDAFAYDAGNGQMMVRILSHEDQGVASPELIARVDAALNGDYARPDTDWPIVQSAQVKTYDVQATLYFYNGPGRAEALAQAEREAQEFTSYHHRIGDDIYRTGLIGAVHNPAIAKINLTVLVDGVPIDGDIAISADEAAYCANLTLTDGGVID